MESGERAGMTESCSWGSGGMRGYAIDLVITIVMGVVGFVLSFCPKLPYVLLAAWLSVPVAALILRRTVLHRWGARCRWVCIALVSLSLALSYSFAILYWGMAAKWVEEECGWLGVSVQPSSWEIRLTLWVLRCGYVALCVGMAIVTWKATHQCQRLGMASCRETDPTPGAGKWKGV